MNSWTEWNARSYASSIGTTDDEEEVKPLSSVEIDVDDIAADHPTPFERYYHPSIPKKHLRFAERCCCCCVFEDDVYTNIQDYVFWNVILTTLSVATDVYKLGIRVHSPASIPTRSSLMSNIHHSVSLINDLLSLLCLIWFYFRICRIQVHELPKQRLVKGAIISLFAAFVYFGETLWVLYTILSLESNIKLVSTESSITIPVHLIDLVNGVLLVWTWLCMLYLICWAMGLMDIYNKGNQETQSGLDENKQVKLSYQSTDTNAIETYALVIAESIGEDLNINTPQRTELVEEEGSESK